MVNLSQRYAFIEAGPAADSNFSSGQILKDYIHICLLILSRLMSLQRHSSVRNFTIALVARNAVKDQRHLPNRRTPAFSLSLALSKKLKHLPFRYSIVYSRLDRYDLSYDDPSEDKVDPLTNEPIKEDKVGKFFDNLGRHFIIGGEYTPSNALALRVGYNYGRRQEMGVDTRKSTVGFSWGIGLKIKQFQLTIAARLSPGITQLCECWWPTWASFSKVFSCYCLMLLYYFCLKKGKNEIYVPKRIS